MRRTLTVLTIAALASSAPSAAAGARADFGRAGPDATVERSPRPLRPVHTRSIVARDPATGKLGVAVQSHWFSVGSAVAWAEACVGARATETAQL